MRCCLFVGLLVSVLGSRVDGRWARRVPVPLAAPGWTISLSVASPRIRSPSAMVAPPGGVVYLGLDREHGSGSAASILALKDDRIWGFADDLGSVRGLEWADGTLYAVHDTVLSALRDTEGDGKGRRPQASRHGPGPEEPIPPAGPTTFPQGGSAWGWMAAFTSPWAIGASSARLARMGGASSFRAEE